MSYGGGTYSAYNKTMPGAYINFVSTDSVFTGAQERGTAAVGLELSWGAEGELITLTGDDLLRSSREKFGEEWGADVLRPLRELLMNASRVIVCRVNAGGTQAQCAFGTAKYPGVTGNRLSVTVSAETENTFTVKTYLDEYLADVQTVASASELTDNDFVLFDASAELAESSGAAFTGGTDGSATSDTHAAFLAKLEEKSFNTLALGSNDNILKNLYKSYTIRMRDEVGVKFQTVLYNCSADHEGIVNVGAAAAGSDPTGFVYWIAGLNAGTLVSETALNRVYTGEYALRDNYTLTQLSDMISRGEFTLHRVGDEVRVLADINSLVNTTANKGEIFKDNRVVRVADRIAADTVSVFTEKYLGRIPNNASGRVSLWADMIAMLGALRDSGAIESFDSDEITVEAGEDKNAVIVSETVTVTGSMAKLYMTCVLG